MKEYKGKNREIIADAFAKLILESAKMGGTGIKCTLQFQDELVDVDFSWKRHEVS